MPRFFFYSIFVFKDEDEDEEEEEGSLKDFIDDGSSDQESGGSDSDIQEVEETGEEKKRTTRGDKVVFLEQYFIYIGDNMDFHFKEQISIRKTWPIVKTR